MAVLSSSRIAWLLTTTELLICPVSAQPARDVLSVEADSRGVYHLESQLFVAASRKTAWEVLTDYEHLDEFVPSMRRSEVKERRGDELLLEQQWVTRVLFLVRTFSVLLAVREEPETGILFRDLSGKDFAFYEGSWRIEPSQQGVWVRYELSAKPVFSVPGFVAKTMFKKAAEDLLREVRLEILGREERAAKAEIQRTTPPSRSAQWVGSP